MNRLVKSFLCLILVTGFAPLAKAETPLALKYIHPDALASGIVDVKTLLNNPAIKKLVQQFQENVPMKERGGFVLTDVDDFRFNMVSKSKPGETAVQRPEFVAITRLSKPDVLTAMISKMSGPGLEEKTQDNLTFKFRAINIGNIGENAPEEVRKRMEEIRKSLEGRGTLIYKIDDRTMLYGTSIPVFLDTPDIKQPATTKPAWSEKFSTVSNKSAVVALNLKQVREIVARERAQQPKMQGMEEILFNSASVIWEKGDSAILSLDTTSGLTLKASVFCSTEEGAKDVAGMFEGIRAIARGLLPSLKPRMEQIPDPEAKKSLEASFASAEKMLTQAKIAHSGTEASLTLSMSQDELTQFGSTVFLNAMRAQKSSAQRTSSINNLKQIALAAIVHTEANKKFPDNSPKKEGGPAVSWRVKILPYIEESALYSKYKMDEPWDSENNKKLLAMMPAVYRHPKQDPASTNSSYYALAGKEGILATGLPSGIKLRDVTDGTSKTLLLVEAEREIPWTKPEDIAVEKGKVPELGIKDQPVFAAARADGSVQLFSKQINAELFWRFFTRNGGERIDENELDPTRPKPIGAQDPATKLPPQPYPNGREPTKADIPPVP